MITPVADRASQRLETVTSQGVFQARAATGLRGGQHSSVVFLQRFIEGVRDRVEILGLEPRLEKGEVVEVGVLLRVQMPRRHLLVEDRRR